MLSDREVLLALYQTTGGPQWNYHDGWNTDADISTWYGVEIRDGRVFELDLRHNNLRGPIPKELGQLSFLEELNLSNNKLDGPIPKELGQLSFLEELNLSHNDLEGPIPQELAGLKKTKLALWGNNLTGLLKTSDREVLLALYRTTGGPQWKHNGRWNTDADISTWYGVIVRDGRVVGLDLGDNNLQGPIPKELGQLSFLEELDLCGNNLEGPIPKELAQLTSVEELDLRHNQLNGPIPQELAELEKTNLMLWGNKLTGLLEMSSDREVLLALYRATGGPEWQRNGGWNTDADISTWYGVEVQDDRVVGLDLHKNNLKGPIPKELVQLTYLEVLDLSRNKLNGPIPMELALLSYLQELDLSRNKLNGPIPQELVGPAKMKLALWGNKLTGSIKKSFSDRDVLVAFYRATGGPHWRYNDGWDTRVDISSWHGVTVRNGRVVKLSLGIHQWSPGNNLKGPILKVLGRLSFLEELDLFNNKLKGPIPKELAGLNNVKVIDLSRNNLTGSIPKELGKLTSLNHLDLRDNKLDGSIPKELGQLTSLTHLELQNNNLDGSIPKELGHLTSLTRLDLSNNKLDGNLARAISGAALDEWRQVVQGNPPDALRRRQMVQGNTENVLAHSYLWRIVENLTALWHFLLPVLDDATDLWLLLETSGGSHRGLWWACFIVFVIADIERVYTAFFFLVSTVLSTFIFILAVINLCLDVEMIRHVEAGVWSILSIFAIQRVDDWRALSWIVLDSLLWTLVGSRARSSPFMKLFGQAGEATGDDLRDSGLGLHGIDVILFFHPMRYFGEFLLAFPKGNRRQEVSDLHSATRRDIAMVRAVGETLCVDPLFLALSVVTGGWDDNLTGFAMVSALFSMLELVTELQYYVNEAEAAKTVVPATISDDVNWSMDDELPI